MRPDIGSATPVSMKSLQFDYCLSAVGGLIAFVIFTVGLVYCAQSLDFRINFIGAGWSTEKAVEWIGEPDFKRYARQTRTFDVFRRWAGDFNDDLEEWHYGVVGSGREAGSRYHLLVSQGKVVRVVPHQSAAESSPRSN